MPDLKVGLKKNKQKNRILLLYILEHLLETNHENMAIWDFFFFLKSGELGPFFIFHENCFFT